ALHGGSPLARTRRPGVRSPEPTCRAAPALAGNERHQILVATERRRSDRVQRTTCRMRSRTHPARRGPSTLRRATAWDGRTRVRDRSPRRVRDEPPARLRRAVEGAASRRARRLRSLFPPRERTARKAARTSSRPLPRHPYGRRFHGGGLALVPVP